MLRRVSIVAARRELGRLAEEVRRTGQPVVLTRRGRAVARIVPEAGTEPGRKRPHDAFAELRGTVRLHCDLDGLQRTIRALRTEFSRSLDRRGARLGARGVRSRA
jgi:prevent-host-death family protein